MCWKMFMLEDVWEFTQLNFKEFLHSFTDLFASLDGFVLAEGHGKDLKLVPESLLHDAVREEEKDSLNIDKYPHFILSSIHVLLNVF